MSNSIAKYFGINLFNDAVMRQCLPKDVYQSLQHTIQSGSALDATAAGVIANAMKNWAIERGATHYTHWFQPLTDLTAEKHDSFLDLDGTGGVIQHLSGKSLIKGEPDASSFPSGGLRNTFEARGYTAWDCTSPAFLKEDAAGITLCIPTAFCSYHGEALDQKTPLLRSMEVLNTHALRILRLFGDRESTRVIPHVGAEQEYFLIDKAMYEQRWDFKLAGCSLMGFPTLKSQAATPHYYGIISDRVSCFMNELDTELWKLGILSKTRHNEAAPCQHEMAPIYTTANIACDQNQLVMETMKKVANRQGLTCLLTEKPFPNINGSGKHNNWSLGTDTGHNLLEPGKTPYDNAQFLLFLSAVIRAVDKYAPLLRLACASASNDRRLGGYEAPPAIISMFVGDDLMSVIEKVKTNVEQPVQDDKLLFGVPTLPVVFRDRTDRNRTSPFAFTGNKFEFRMPGASQSLSECNTALNTIVAETLDRIATRLEMAEDFETEVREIFRDILFGHERILFDGNGYSEEWRAEAARRGLPILNHTAACLPVLLQEDIRRLYEDYGVYTRAELDARFEILTLRYLDQINLEARVVNDMATRQIIPAAVAHLGELSYALEGMRAAGLENASVQAELERLNNTLSSIYAARDALFREMSAPPDRKDLLAAAFDVHDRIRTATATLSQTCDAMEALMPRDKWPMPTFDDILYQDIQV